MHDGAPLSTPVLPLWHQLTRLGESQLLLPLALLGLVLLWRSPSQRPLVRRWALGLAAAVGVTTASKLAFMGWGWGSAGWDFTGFSGHSMCAAAVLPLLAWLGLRGQAHAAWRRAGLALGFALAALIAYSRLPVGAHSPSEALTGYLLGAAASAWALRRAVPDMAPAGPGRLLPSLLPGLMLLALLALPHWSPPARTHQWVTRLALELSGRSHPYTRHQLHRDAAALNAAGEAHPGTPATAG